MTFRPSASLNDRVLTGCVLAAGLGLALASSSWRLVLASSFVWLLVALPGVLSALVDERDAGGTLARAVLGCAASLLGMVTLGTVLRTSSTPLMLLVPLLLTLPLARRWRSEHWQALRGRLSRAVLPVPLSLMLLFTLASLALPFLGVGRVVDAEHRFMAFFCADLFKHAAHTNALAFGTIPPGDPFASAQHLQYYWYQALLPALSVRLAGSQESAIAALLVHELIQSVMLFGLLYAVARRMGAGAVAAAVAPGFALLAGFDGIAAQIAHGAEGFWHVLQAINVEGEDLTAAAGAPSWLVSNSLYRALLYMPQHCLALLATLAWWFLQNEPEPSAGAERGDFLLAAVLPGLSIFVAPIVLVAAALYRWWRRRQLGLWLLLGVLCGSVLLMAATGFEWRGDPRFDAVVSASEPRTPLAWALAQTLIAFGPALALVALGNPSALAVRPGGELVLITLGVALVAWLSSELVLPGLFATEVQLKSSLIVWLGLVPCAACTLSALRTLPARRRQLAFLCLGLQPLTALTLLHDVIGHSVWPWASVSRSRTHVSVPVAEMEALTWMRSSLPAAALVHQWPEPHFIDGGRDAWVPIFAGRGIYASPRGTTRSFPLIDARAISAERNTWELWARCRARGIEVLYVSRTLEPGAARQREAALVGDGRAFRKLFANASVSIWQVVPPATPGVS